MMRLRWLCADLWCFSERLPGIAMVTNEKTPSIVQPRNLCLCPLCPGTRRWVVAPPSPLPRLLPKTINVLLLMGIVLFFFR